MTHLEDLQEHAKEVIALEPNYKRMIVPAETMLEMINLMFLMREAFKAWPHHFTSKNAIEAFEKFNREV